MTYSMTQKRRDRDFLQVNWQLHLEVFILRNQGWRFAVIGERFGLSRQRVFAMYQKMTRLTVEEAEKVQNYVDNLPIDNTSK